MGEREVREKERRIMGWEIGGGQLVINSDAVSSNTANALQCPAIEETIFHYLTYDG